MLATTADTVGATRLSPDEGVVGVVVSKRAATEFTATDKGATALRRPKNTN